VNHRREPVDDWVRRYLHLLGVEREAPDPAALARLTRAHLLAVPFGNVTALLRYGSPRCGAPPPPDLDELLREWEERRGTGACFEIVPAFSGLLAALGYEAVAVPGLTGSFMGGHQAIVVAFGDERYLVDVAIGLPLFEPIPLDRVVEVRRAGLAHRFRPGDEPEEFLQERWQNGAWTHVCRYELRGLGAAESEAAYHRLHTPIAGSVIGVLRVVRCTETAVYSLRNAELTQFTEGGKRTERLEGPGDYKRAMTEVFDLPRLPILEALAVLEARDGVN
jgi:N-hydroxyarylamine O-acetyltransferase